MGVGEERGTAAGWVRAGSDREGQVMAGGPEPEKWVVWAALGRAQWGVRAECRQRLVRGEEVPQAPAQARGG